MIDHGKRDRAREWHGWSFSGYSPADNETICRYIEDGVETPAYLDLKRRIWTSPRNPNRTGRA